MKIPKNLAYQPLNYHTYYKAMSQEILKQSMLKYNYPTTKTMNNQLYIQSSNDSLFTSCSKTISSMSVSISKQRENRGISSK
jgi:hypothetical protein